MRIPLIVLATAVFFGLPAAASAETDKTLATYDTPGTTLGVAASGNYAYVADGDSNAVVILDVSDPAAPTLAGSYALTNASGLALVNNRLYVTNGTSLTILSLADPAAPTLLGQYDGSSFPGTMTVGNVATDGTTAYITGYTSGPQFILNELDVSDPANPSSNQTTWINGAADVAFEGSNVYVVSDREMEIFDTDLTLWGTYTDPQDDASYQDVAVEGTVAYVSDIMHGFHAINVSNPSNPTAIYDSSPTDRYGGGIAVSDGFAFVGDYFSGGLAIYSAPGSGDPVFVDDYAGISGANAIDLTVAGDVAFVTLGADGVHLLDISRPDSIEPTVTLLGRSTVELRPGEAYTDRGAEASDNLDGDLTSEVVRTGSLDRNKVGRYVRTYTATDSSGNSASVERVFIVVPVLTVLTSTNGRYAISVHGTPKVLRPFPTYTKTILARKIIVGRKSEPFYVFVMTSAIEKPKLAIYNHHGTRITLKSLAAISTRGLNVQLAADPTSRLIFIGIAPKTNSLTAHLYRFGKTGLKSLGTVIARRSGSGQLIMKFLKTYTREYGLVTHIRNSQYSPRVWRYSNGLQKFRRDANHDLANLVWDDDSVALR